HRPLLLATGQVDVSHQWRDGRLVQQIGAGSDVFATVTVDYATAQAPGISGTSQHSVTPRHSDLDSTGRIGLIALFEYMQEARIAFISRQIQAWAAGGFVVARVAMTSYRPVPMTTAPYDVHATIGRVGTSSVAVHTQVVDGQ